MTVQQDRREAVARLLALAERVEAANGPDRVLDVSIYDAITNGVYSHDNRRWCRIDWTGRRPLPFTASLDAAMTLVPEGWIFGAVNSRMSEPNVAAGGSAFCGQENAQAETAVQVEASTPALALSAAALRALASKEQM